jgi:hypothetical protein
MYAPEFAAYSAGELLQVQPAERAIGATGR